MVKKNKINLLISSSLTSPVALSLFSVDNANGNTGINQHFQYSWNITQETFTSISTVSLQYKSSVAAAFTTITTSLLSRNVQGLVDALNALKIGRFFSYTSGGQTFVSALNDYTIYGTLITNGQAFSYAYAYGNAPAPAVTATSSFLFLNLTTGDVLGIAAVTMSGSGNIPTATSPSVPPGSWSPGDSIRFRRQLASGPAHVGRVLLYRNDVLISDVTTGLVTVYDSPIVPVITVNDKYNFIVNLS